MTDTTFYLICSKGIATRKVISREQRAHARAVFLEQLRLHELAEVYEVVEGVARKLNYWGNE